jgi:hypothetical protein
MDDEKQPNLDRSYHHDRVIVLVSQTGDGLLGRGEAASQVIGNAPVELAHDGRRTPAYGCDPMRQGSA